MGYNPVLNLKSHETCPFFLDPFPSLRKQKHTFVLHSDMGHSSWSHKVLVDTGRVQ